jgi:hypothetical protein
MNLCLKHSPTKPGFMALINVATFDRHIDVLNYEALEASVVRQSQQNRVFAWGCPEGAFQLRITSTLDKTSFHSVESIEGTIETSGDLCVSSSGNLLLNAQFPNSQFPRVEPMFGDAALSITPGRYSVEVHRMFKWKHGEQYADEFNEGDNFVIVLKPLSSESGKKPYLKIPWTYD